MALTEADGFHALEHFLWRRKLVDRCGKILIRTTDAGNHCPNLRQHLAEVEAIEFAQQAAGLAEIQYANFTLRLEDAEDFAEAGIIIRQVAESE